MEELVSKVQYRGKKNEVKNENHLEWCGFDLAFRHTNLQMNYFKIRVSTVIYEVIASQLSLFQ